MSANVWPGTSVATRNALFIDPASGTSAAGNVRTRFYNDFANWRFLGSRGSNVTPFDSLSAGRWFCVEAHARLNDSTGTGGLFEMWVDDSLQARRTSLNWVGNFRTFGINAVIIENLWAGGPPRMQVRIFDDLVVSTARIGC
jgi:hypothetical protein